MNSLKSFAMNCGPLSEMIRGRAPGKRSLALSSRISISASFIESRKLQSIKSECIRPGVPLCLDDAERLIAQYVAVYNEQRLHSSLGYVTPKDMLEGRQAAIHAERDRKLEEAARKREASAKKTTENPISPSSLRVA